MKSVIPKDDPVYSTILMLDKHALVPDALKDDVKEITEQLCYEYNS